MNVLVVGAGAMGRWFGESIHCDLAFADADPAVAENAANELGGRAVELDTSETFDAVCLAVPLPVVEGAIEEHAVKAERALLDLTGVMAEPVSAMAERVPDKERVSLHPLFGPENAPGNVAVVVDEPGPVTDDLLSALESRGNTLVETTPDEHDEAMKTVQASAHTAILAFALSANSVPDGLRTPVYDCLTDLSAQVTSGDSRVYADIQAAFDGAEDVAAAANELADATVEEFEHLYRDAKSNGDTNAYRNETDPEGKR
ncbi:prephenate dehydrogenase/arogenate dehydrogenase family protein [Haladaptatus caseinilyticus]|uniref:prephenate dehydrogenase/arogenate dehydrogenase family protein n=1 Tax=Haladaptatus caseinilyticus TaxID=2993314 RepID=UPI00224ABED7|nr:prephenate dehydrogenase/arogenate dehydrogenase family protein [Haladaptatus caseinilyticus]